MTLRVGTLASNLALAAALGGPNLGDEIDSAPVPAPQPTTKPRLRPFTVQVQYLLPIFTHVTVEAETTAEACELAVANDDWDGARESHESSRTTTVAGIVTGHHEDIYSGARALKVPPNFQGEEELMRLACTALLDSRQAGGPRRSIRRAIALARMALPHHKVKPR